MPPPPLALPLAPAPIPGMTPAGACPPCTCIYPLYPSQPSIWTVLITEAPGCDTPTPYRLLSPPGATTNRYDPSRGLSRLAEAWVSQAAAQQRKGRAGRVQPGTCYRLLPSELWGRLAAQQAPEVLRVPLEQLCLATKAALAAAAAVAAGGGGGGAADVSSSRAGSAAREGGGGRGGGGGTVDLFRGLQGAKLQDILAQLLTPPDPASIEAAVLHLTRLGALAPADESLTPLGRHLVAMPMDADLGKALIYGCMLRCTGPLLTIAAAAAYGRPVWVSPGDKRAAAEAAKRAVAAAAYAQRSDHLAIVAAYNGWLSARAAGGRREAAEYCSKSFLSYQVRACCWVGRQEAGRELLIPCCTGFLTCCLVTCVWLVSRAHLPCAAPLPALPPPPHTHNALAGQGSFESCLQVKYVPAPPLLYPWRSLTHSHAPLPPTPPHTHIPCHV